MANEKTNKVVLGSEVLIDLTDATASADEILLGYSAYGADGNKLVGTADVKGDTIIIVNYDDEFRGQTITCSKSGTTYTKTAPSNKNEVRFYPTSTGEWDITCTLDGELYETSATIFTLDDIVECELEYLVDGSTVLPINDVPTWLKCAKLESLGYTTLAQVIEDTDTLEALLGDSNACAYLVRSTGFAVINGLVPIMTSNTTPSGVASAGSVYTVESGYEEFRAFDNNDSTFWCGNTAVAKNDSATDYIQYQFTEAKKVRAVKLVAESNVANTNVILKGSNDGSTFTPIGTYTSDFDFIVVDNDTAYEYIGAEVTQKNNYNASARLPHVNTLQFYSESTSITENEQAMTILGKYDYACNVLLADATWAEAIANSDYFESVLTASVPKMTSNTAPEGEAFASESGGGTYPYQAFDGNLSQPWGTANTVHEASIGYKFTSPVSVHKIKAYGVGRTFSTLKIQASNDGITYQDIKTFSDITQSANTWYEYLTDSDNTKYQYWRIYGVTTANSVAFYELQFYGRPSAKLIPLVPTMTDNTHPSGTVHASVENISGALPYYAFDGQGGDGSSNVYHFWADNTVATFVSPCYLQYTFDTPVVASKVHLVSRWSDKFYPKDFTIYGSNDGGVTKETLLTVTNHSATEYVFDSVLDNDTAYTTYGVECISSNMGNMAINVLQFYAEEPQTNRIVSAPYDTIYYIEDGNPVVITTTNVNGVGEVDWSDLPLGEVTLYSSVANDPNNLANPYAKSIIVTPNKVEAILMPIGALYWWGWVNALVEDFYGSDWVWSLTGNNVTWNTNNVTLGGSSGIGTKNKLPTISKAIVVWNCSAYSSSAEGELRITSAKNPANSIASVGENNINAIVKRELAGTDVDAYIAVMAVRMNVTLYAWLYE